MMLGGTMFWTLDFDDYTGMFCNEGPFPLANAIKDVFDEYSPPPTIASTQNTTTVTTITTITTVEVKPLKKNSTSTGSLKRLNSSASIISVSNSSKISYVNIIGSNITFIRNNGHLLPHKNGNNSISSSHQRKNSAPIRIQQPEVTIVAIIYFLNTLEQFF